MTQRQWIMEILREGEISFVELRRTVEISAQDLEADLRHIEHSLRHNSERLHVIPAQCTLCDFVFQDRALKHFHAPSRCPKCRSERIDEPRFFIE